MTLMMTTYVTVLVTKMVTYSDKNGDKLIEY